MSFNRVLVTGGTGFIGGRLVEKLILGRGVHVRCLVRDLSRAARLARFPLELRHGDLSRPDTVRQAVKGVEVVFHCASDAVDPEVARAAAEVIADAAAKYEVKRLVHLGSAAVYQPPESGALDETAPVVEGDGPAARALAAEQHVVAAAEAAGVAWTVVQPEVVYGPYGREWTSAIAHRLRQGPLMLPRLRIGHCQPLYVDDIADAMVAAVEAPAAAGQRYLLASPEPITWHQFYSAFEAALGTQAVTLLEEERLAELLASQGSRGASGGGPLGWLDGLLGRFLPARTRQALSDRRQPTAPAITAAEVDRLRRRVAIDTSRARDQLGFKPRFDFERGMELTAAWMKWANL